ncbi:MAG: hypothetical protein ACPGRW_09220 [Flavobacteriaceae bacterium]
MRVLFAICMCCSVLCSGQSKLEIAKKRLAKRTEVSITSNDSNDTYYDDSEDKKQTFGQKIAQFLFVELIAKPIYHGTKYVLVGDAHNVSVYNPIPYENNTGGEYIPFYGDEEGVSNFRLSLLQASLSYTSGQFNINGVHPELEYRFNDLHGVTVKYDRFTERHFGKTEVLELSGITYNHYRIRERGITAWWSLGLAGVTDIGGGLRYGVGARLFLKKPLSLLVSWQQDLMEHGTINEAKIQLDYHWKKMSFFAGFNHFNIAKVRVPSMAIGLRYKFR